MLSVMEKIHNELMQVPNSLQNLGRFGSLSYFHNSNIKQDDFFKFGYQILSRFGINYLSLSHLTTFETKLYEWVYKYIVGRKVPMSIKMLRGMILEKYLLSNIGLYGNVDDFVNEGVSEFQKIVEEKKDDLVLFTDDELKETTSFVENALRLNYGFFKERIFTNQSLPVHYRLKDAINIYGIVDAVLNRKEFDAVIEMKTTDRIPQEPNESHIRQLAFYLLTTELPYGYIYYVGSGGKSLRKGNIYFRAFVYEREKLINYILEYIEVMTYKLINFLSRFNSSKEIIDSVVPQYTDFFFNQELREEYASVFGLKEKKPIFTSSIELSI